MSSPIDAVTWVAALDGGKALIWRNEGFDDHPNLQLLDEKSLNNPPARDLANDRPGRMADTEHGKSSMTQTDDHELDKTRFVETVIDQLNGSAAKGEFDRLLVLAPASILGMARPRYSEALSSRLIERERDVVHQPTEKIDAQFIAAMKD